MTVTYNSTDSEFTIQSSLLADFTGVTSVTLTVKKGCDSSKVFTIEEADVTGDDDDEYIFDEDDAGFDFEQYVYSFTLKVVYTSSIKYEYYCYLLDKDLSCRVKSVVASTDYDKSTKMYIMLLHHQLTQSNICHKEGCSDYCTIFKDLDNELSMLSC
jgi:hypothetical protein